MLTCQPNEGAPEHMKNHHRCEGHTHTSLHVPRDKICESGIVSFFQYTKSLFIVSLSVSGPPSAWIAMVGVGATALFLIFAITMEHGDAVTAPDRTEDMTVLSGGEAELCPDPSGHHCSPATCCPAQTQCSQATGSRATDGWVS